MHCFNLAPYRDAGRRRVASARKQAGVILIIALIALTILMIGAVALVRSFDTSMLLSGNMAFKRDLMNQGERGMAQAITALSAGGSLASEGTRQADVAGSNYSATSLASDAHGIPQVLLNDATFIAAYTASDITDVASKVIIRYVIDRQCAAAGAFSADTCTTTTATESDKGGSSFLKKAGGGLRPVYRISVRVTGPRNTQAYLQTTVTL